MTGFFSSPERPDPRRAFPSLISLRGSNAGETRPCSRCGETQPLSEFSVDRSKSSGRKSHCRRCDCERSARYYLENREAVLARDADRRSYDRRSNARPPALRHCSECSAELTGQQRATCGSSACKDKRFRRLHPDSYAERERQKVERRRAKRRGVEGGE